MDSPSSRTIAESPAPKSQLRSRRGCVRVVAKVRPLPDSEAAGPPTNEPSNRPQISILRPIGDPPSIVFGGQAASRKDSCKMDGCYGPEEGAGEIFDREIKPLIQRVCHQGSNACVISYGATGSGKTQMIQGSEGNPGLAPMAVSEILMFAEETGASVSISCYGVYQDHVNDVLEPKEKEVLVLEDGRRKIQLKGLSVVPVKSITEFNKFYFDGRNQRKSSQKIVSDVPTRNHKGLIVYVNRVDKKSNNTLVGKMNFVDLAGYEDIKNSNGKPQLTESAKVNKSLYALLNVVSALNSDETYVPYRESKLTRLLQDSLCRGNGAVLIACLNSTLCQNTIHAVSLASRSCQAVNQHKLDSAKCSKTAPKFVPPFSPISGGKQTSVNRQEISQLGPTEKKGNGSPSIIKRRPQPLRISVLKPTPHASTEKKAKHSPSLTKGRKLFNAVSPISSSVQVDPLLLSTVGETSVPDGVKDEVMETSIPDEAKYEVVETSIPNGETRGSYIADNDVEYSTAKVDVYQSNENNFLQRTDPGLDSQESTGVEDNQKSSTDACESSPPLSERLREISNQLKLLSSKPICKSKQVDAGCTAQVTEPMDPKTPEVLLRYNPIFENSSSTPQDILEVQSTGLKKSLVQECLAFLNNASREELKRLKGIGQKRADYILQLREREENPFKEVNDLKILGLSSKKIKEMMIGMLGEFCY